MKTLPITNDKLHVVFRMYPTTAAMRRAVRRAIPDEVPPNAIGYHLGDGRVSNIFLAEHNQVWYECGLHECIHSADYLSRYRPKGVDADEFRAYFADGLYSCLVRWALSGFVKDPRVLDFSPGMTRMAQAIDPDNTTKTT